jgi:hypothetical protein
MKIEADDKRERDEGQGESRHEAVRYGHGEEIGGGRQGHAHRENEKGDVAQRLDHCVNSREQVDDGIVLARGALRMR